MSNVSVNGVANIEDAAARVAAIEAKRAARKAASEAPRLEQLARDLEALDDAEVEHGDGRVARINLDFFEPGLPTFVLARMPKQVEFKRFQDMSSAKKGGDGAATRAGNLLADGCRIYPDADTYKRVLERSPGVHANVAVECIKLAQGHAEEEGKG